MNAVTVGLAVMKLLPLIAETIQQVELLDQTPGNGAAKKAAALDMLKVLYNTAEPNPTIPFDNLVSAITEIITALVTFYNGLGKFIKGTAVPKAA